jgi:predicted RNA polymerase sigma factor
MGGSAITAPVCAADVAADAEGLVQKVGALEGAPSMYHLLPSVRGDLLATLGRSREARREFDRAAALATNQQERKLLHERASRAVPEKTGL